MGKLFTIGHSQHEIDYFMKLLKKYHIDSVCDVRSIPYSKYAGQYNRENIEKTIARSGMQYAFMGASFGARPAEKALYCEEGCLDFERVRKSEGFLRGFHHVMQGLQQGRNIALMCTEKDPFDCHRAILVSRAFALAGVEVNHILADGTLQHQNQLNERLMNRYFPQRDQISFWDYMNKTEPADDLSRAYQLRNKEIGYRLKNEG
ncbi:MAG: DUF488 family protein [Anaerovoracaceae bacterium]